MLLLMERGSHVRASYLGRPFPDDTAVEECEGKEHSAEFDNHQSGDDAQVQSGEIDERPGKGSTGRGDPFQVLVLQPCFKGHPGGQQERDGRLHAEDEPVGGRVLPSIDVAREDGPGVLARVNHTDPDAA